MLQFMKDVFISVVIFKSNVYFYATSLSPFAAEGRERNCCFLRLCNCFYVCVYDVAFCDNKRKSTALTRV